MNIRIFQIDVSAWSETRCVLAWSNDDRAVVGIATWDDEGRLEIVRVEKPYRRRGAGTRLLKAAEKVHGSPLVDTGVRSSEGTALLKSMGREPAPLTQRLTGREVEAVGTLLLSRLYGVLAWGGADEFNALIRQTVAE